MKKYNLSEIMKAAHNIYKTGKYTWAESLKKSWKMAKFRISSRIEALQIKQEMKADKDSERKRLQEINSQYINVTPAKRSRYDSLDIPASAYYNPNSTGKFGAHYVGD
jgi:hypothetical protein